jgi:alpha-galactosidase
LEAYRKDDALNISGGQADREFGHWVKKVAPGEIFETPVAILSVVEGSIDDIAGRMTDVQLRALKKVPDVEEDLPLFQ